MESLLQIDSLKLGRMLEYARKGCLLELRTIDTRISKLERRPWHQRLASPSPSTFLESLEKSRARLLISDIEVLSSALHGHLNNVFVDAHTISELNYYEKLYWDDQLAKAKASAEELSPIL